MKLTLAEIEKALDAGHLFVAMRNGNHWRVRRNGATKLWKTRPSEFRVPFKAGIKTYGYIDDGSKFGPEGSGAEFEVRES